MDEKRYEISVLKALMGPAGDRSGIWRLDRIGRPEQEQWSGDEGLALMELRQDGIYLKDGAFPEFTSDYVAGMTGDESLGCLLGKPVLRIPFTVAELFRVQGGALGIVEGLYCGSETDELLAKLNRASTEAVEVANALMELVGTRDVQHEEDAQRKAQALEEARRKGRKKLGIDAKLARVDKKLAAELAGQKSKLDEALAPLKDGVTAGDETAIQRSTSLREAAELQDAKSRAFAKLKREKIRQEFDAWRAQDSDYLRLCVEADEARRAADDAEKAWRTAMLRQLLPSGQAAPEKTGPAPTPLAGQASDQRNDAQQDTTAQPAIDRSLLATPDQLIRAYGSFTGMDVTWFSKTKDKPKLHAAIKIAGTSGRKSTPPLLCPLEVMQWLTDPKRRIGRMLSQEKGWERLKAHFPGVYVRHSAASPLED